MSEMVRFQDISLAPDGRSLLELLLEQGVDIPNSCRAGLCQSCVMLCREGDPGADSQKGLKAVHAEMGHFLACQCRPSGNLLVDRVDAKEIIEVGSLESKEWLNDSVLCVRVRSGLPVRAGQYVTLWKGQETGRSYSVASASGSDVLEFHVKVYPDGKLSSWLAEALQPGDTIGLQGPMGTCVYPKDCQPNMLLLGMGTGLAPLQGIVFDALSSGYKGRIELVTGAQNSKSLYLPEKLGRLISENEQVHVHRLCQKSEDPEYVPQDIYQYARSLVPDLKNWEVFICGADSFVKKMRKQCFLEGASMSRIHADSFG